MNRRPMIGAVLAAGHGTRLRPLTNHLPKPLVPVCGRPLLEYAFDHLKRLEIDTIGINAHHLADHLQDAFAHRDEEIFVVHEEELQGTGGGIREIARHHPESTLVVINGDALFDFSLAPLLRRHRERQALGTLALRYVPPGAPFGRVAIDGSGRLHRIAELSAPGADALTLFYGAFTGVQILEPELIQCIPDGPCDVLRSAYKTVLADKGPIYGDFVAPDCVWVDVGTPERYLIAHQIIQDGHLDTAYLPEPDESGRRIASNVNIDPSAELVGPCVILDGAEIGAGSRVGPYCVIGRGARVTPGTRIRGSVVWDHVTVSGDVKEEIILGD